MFNHGVVILSMWPAKSRGKVIRLHLTTCMATFTQYPQCLFQFKNYTGLALCSSLLKVIYFAPYKLWADQFSVTAVHIILDRFLGKCKN